LKEEGLKEEKEVYMFIFDILCKKKKIISTNYNLVNYFNTDGEGCVV